MPHKKMKIAVVSLGCSKNLVDTEVMLGHLADSGCEVIDDPESADCILINTCSFLTEAVSESLDRIVELAAIKGKGSVKRLVVAGCMVSRYGQELKGEVPEIDALVSPSSLEQVMSAVMGRDIVPSTDETFPTRLISFPPHRAYLKIGDGCSNHCTYCMIPRIRGEFVSRPLPSIVDEARWLVQRGVKEITLVAQDTGRYGMDRGGEDLPELIRSILEVRGDFWLRGMYIHPSRVSGRLLEALSSDERVCRYMDVPFQHVSPSLLGRMGRGAAPEPRRVLEMVRKQLPGVFFRTTLMTGFPGETEDDFQALLSFVREAEINHLGVFAYSREKGTPAAGLMAQVDPGTARERLELLMEEQSRISRVLLKDMIGLELEVLVEGEDDEGAFGRHRGQAPEVDGVVRLNRRCSPGDRVMVRIMESGDYDLEGEIISGENPRSER
ncbi:MAG: 30S ribosomal protein S12 methylthiotransferase RimO [Deltaproteobacteria bacterium]|nr:30S ribosomal protein S12 methylthiotransferase RimO [Deltaproteobacteria bacterium]